MNSLNVKQQPETDDVSPVFVKLAAIEDTLVCAIEHYELLAMRLAPIRESVPKACSDDALSKGGPTKLESKLETLLDKASRLSALLSELRCECRL